jgi:molybdopterin/thiamine biosynthesis adenylyltransferase/proteasome lid subunit RPN8/RPN11
MANDYVALTDDVVDAIERDVASHRPERGGALLGPIGQPMVTRFLFDPDARTSGSTYQPSRKLAARIQQIEVTDSLVELKGILHSHPAGFARPSNGDLVAFADSLRGAPWLGRFVTPIVTNNGPGASHDIGVRSGKISVFIAEGRNEGVELLVARPHVVPIVADTAALARFLRGRATAPSLIDVDGVTYVASGVEFGAYAIQVLIGPSYPFTPPIVLVSQLRGVDEARTRLVGLPAAVSTGSTASLPLSWDQSISEGTRLVAAVAPFFGSNAMAAETTANASGVPRLKNPAEGQAVRTGIGDRLTGITSPALQSKRVLMVGAGSGGSTTAEALVRSGVEHLVVIDPDAVGPENLSRSVYVASDVGTPKVEALGRRLRSINPLVELEGRPNILSDLRSEELAELVRSVDLVIAATDDPKAQRKLNHFSYACGIPSMYAGMYAKGRAGEVVFVVPEITRCYRCATASRQGGVESERRTDYGTGRLMGEPALGADILHVVTASVKVALGLLEIEEDEGASRDFIYGCLESNLTYLVLSTVPSYDYFSKVFEGVAGQHAYQSVWLSVAGDPECPVCGDSRADPLSVSSGSAPDLSRLRPVTDHSLSATIDLPGLEAS